jgi:2'-5' RNA ligase
VRLFVAVWPPVDVVERLSELPRPAVDGVRWTTPDQWHVTIRFLGEVADPTSVSGRLGSEPLPACEAVMGPTSECATASVLWLPVTGLEPLAEVVGRLTGEIGLPPEATFRGHLTLARARRGAHRRVLRRLPPLECAARWDVTEVTVVASTLGGTGSRYDVLDRVRLGP